MRVRVEAAEPRGARGLACDPRAGAGAGSGAAGDGDGDRRRGLHALARAVNVSKKALVSMSTDGAVFYLIAFARR